MEKIDIIREKNKNLIIKSINNKEFNKFGRILENFDCSEYFNFIEKNMEFPLKGNYVASVEILENFITSKKIKSLVYGEMDIEVGYCTGQNTVAAGMEYHHGSETIIAITDCILVLGQKDQMIGNDYEIRHSKIFYVPSGTIIEIYSTTLHYTPIKVDEKGFATIVFLLKGTNDPLRSIDISGICIKKNKWFITHESQNVKIESGCYPGVKGKLLEINI